MLERTRSNKTFATHSEGGGTNATPQIGAVRQFSPLNSGGSSNSSLFFKVKWIISKEQPSTMGRLASQ